MQISSFVNISYFFNILFNVTNSAIYLVDLWCWYVTSGSTEIELSLIYIRVKNLCNY